MNPEEVREAQFRIIIAMLKEDEDLQKQVKAYMGWCSK